MWHDEAVGAVSRDARLLFIGLITLADDEGRFRALPSLVLGHAFPYDADAPRRLAKWIEELEQASLLVTYQAGEHTYGWLPGWSNQKISKPSESRLPAPPNHGAFPDQSRNGS
jgi:hypothetical protein